MAQNKILFICMGNICRSPSAEAVFASLLAKAGIQDRFEIDSAGTHAYHVGHSPDDRSMVAAMDRGINMQHMRARQVEAADFDRFDRLIVMDKANLDELKSRFPNQQHDKLSLMMSYATDRSESEVPDPYYGGDDGFELVLDLLTDASAGLLAEYTDDSNDS